MREVGRLAPERAGVNRTRGPAGGPGDGANRSWMGRGRRL